MRSKLYLGPKIQIFPTQLSSFDNGKWWAEEKYDGIFVSIETDGSGLVSSVKSRTDTKVQSSLLSGILGANIHFPNTIFAGELEAITQASVKRYNGHRRVYLFDVIKLLNEDVTVLPYEKRRELLDISSRRIDNSHFCLARKKNSGFLDLYQDIISCDGEGIVLKKLGSTYKPEDSSGKTSSWVRVKQINTVDFLVMGIGHTPSRAENLEIGLLRSGKIERVQAIAVPKGMKAADLVGKVIECEGDVQMNSGALRHARFLRIRVDKTKEMVDSCQ